MARILVVDDRAKNRELLVTLLGYCGHTLLEASDGREALDIANVHLPELIISDILMPNMDGVEFVQAMRRHAHLASLPVIFCTASYHRSEAVALGRACGVDRIIIKPLEPQTLIDEVNVALGAEKALPLPNLAGHPAFSGTEQRTHSDLHGLAKFQQQLQSSIELGLDRIERALDDGGELQHLQSPLDDLSASMVIGQSLNARLTTLVELGLSLSVEHDLAKLLAVCVEAVRDLLSARYAAVGLNNADGEPVHVITRGMADSVRDAFLLAGQPSGIFAQTLISGQPQHLRAEDGIRPEGFPREHPLVTSILVLPIRSRGFTFGWLYVANKVAASAFSREDEYVGIAVAAQLTLAYENLQLLDTVKDRNRRLERALAEQTKAEQYAHTIEHRFTQLWEVTSDAVLLVDGEGYIRYANPSVLPVFGHAPQALIGQPLTELIPERLQAAHCAGFQRYLATGVKTVDWRSHENVGLHQQGHEFPIELSYCHLDSEAEPLFAGIIRDITRRKLAEAQLAESDRRLNDMLDNVQLLSLMLDNQGNVIYCNDFLLQLTGWHRQDVIGRNWQQQFGLPDSAGLYQPEKNSGEAANAGAIAWHHECEILTRYGERRLIRCNSTVLRACHGEVIGSATIGEDITERRVAKQALQESEQRFRQVTENIREAFFLVNASGKDVLYISPAYESIWGRSCASLYEDPMSWFEATHPADRSRVREALIGSTSGFDSRYRIVRPDGTVRWIRAKGFPIENDDGEVYRIAGVAEDVTEQHEQMLRIAKLNRLYAFLSGINSTVIRAQDRDRLLLDVCRIAVEVGGFSSTWIATRESVDGDFGLAAWFGLSAEQVAILKEGIPIDGKTSASRLARCVSAQLPIICNELDSVSDDVVTGSGKRSEASHALVLLPILIAQRCVAVLALFAETAESFDAEEMQLLTELSTDVGMALQFISTEERLNFLACYDPLTGLANRGLLLEWLQHGLQEAKCNHGKLVLVLLDIDHFTHFNDTMGCHGGDVILREVARRLQHAGNGTNRVARLGSDTFAVYASHLSDLLNIVSFIEQVIQFPLRQPLEVSGKNIVLSAHFGVALSPDDSLEAETLLHHAETALLHARTGSVEVLFYRPELNRRLAEIVELEDKLRGALSRREFFIELQPRVDINSGRIVAAEALLRWRHPELGLISPLRFIPLAEDAGLIVAIGDWVLETVCAQQSAWQRAGVPIVPIAVNLSAVQLRRNQLPAMLAMILQRNELVADFLEIELTESTVMHDPEEAGAVLLLIRDMGVKIAMDDFGTGYSSLAYLKRLPFHCVKIDRSFITDIPDNPESAAIASAVIAMAHSLKLRVVAEGVETAAQVEYLRSQRCDEIQGYFCSRPVPEQEFQALLTGASSLLSPSA